MKETLPILCSQLNLVHLRFCARRLGNLEYKLINTLPLSWNIISLKCNELEEKLKNCWSTIEFYFCVKEQLFILICFQFWLCHTLYPLVFIFNYFDGSLFLFCSLTRNGSSFCYQLFKRFFLLLALYIIAMALYIWISLVSVALLLQQWLFSLDYGSFTFLFLISWIRWLF